MDTEEFEKFRMAHLVRTAELWKVFVEKGITEDSVLDFDFLFTTQSEDSVKSLQDALSDYSFEVGSKGVFGKTFSLSSTTGAITWTEEQLIRWVDYLIQIGSENGCEFDGCGASVL